MDILNKQLGTHGARPSERNPETTLATSIHQANKKISTSEWVEKDETYSHHKSHSAQHHAIWRDSQTPSLFLRAKDFNTTSMAPTLKSFTLVMDLLSQIPRFESQPHLHPQDT